MVTVTVPVGTPVVCMDAPGMGTRAIWIGSMQKGFSVDSQYPLRYFATMRPVIGAWGIGPSPDDPITTVGSTTPVTAVALTVRLRTMRGRDGSWERVECVEVSWEHALMLFEHGADEQSLIARGLSR